jgi:small GTP-binding protein
MGLLTNLRSSISRAVSSLFSDEDSKRIGIYGPPNAGKCLAPDENVLLADGTRKPISEVFDAVAGTDPPDVSDAPDERWLECTRDLRVPALTSDLAVESMPVSHVFRQDYQGQLYRVRTRRGREVTVSPSHPFIARTDEGVTHVPAGNLDEGDPVAALPTTGLRGATPNRPATDGGTVAAHTGATPPEVAETDLVAAGDIVWDEVDTIEPVEHDGYIYDLTVPEHHTFATADGLVVHNTTLANRIVRDWTEHGDAVGPESHVPHETRRARRKENVEIERNGQTVTIDVVDTPGVTTKVDYTEFLEHDMDEEDAIRRSREATEGVAEAMHWLREDVDGVIYVLDSTTDPFTQVNTMLVGIIESQDLPVLILANKIDLEDSSVQRIRNAFPQHETIPLSALEGDNMDEVYDKIAEYFG